MKETFDGLAKIYDEWYEEERGRRIDDLESELILSVLKPREKDLILDVGCGTGNYSLKLAKFGCNVVGIDPSKDMIERAVEKSKNLGLSNVRFEVARAENIPFPDGYFDAVVSVTAIEFFKSVERSVREMFRVLKEKGRLVIGTINRESPWGKLYMEKAEKGHPIYSHARFLTIEELKSTCERFGNVVESAGCLKIPPDASLEDISEAGEGKYTNPPGFIVVKCLKKE